MTDSISESTNNSILNEYYRDKIDLKKNQQINFQVISWNCYDEEFNDDEDDLEYKIYMFGVTENSESVCLKVDDFTPYFFAKIPDELQSKWTDFHTTEVKNYLIKKLWKSKKGLVKVTVIDKFDIDGFKNEERFKFLKIIFKNEKTYKRAKYILSPGALRPKPVIPSISPKDLIFTLYEANIEPFIRFCHIQDIKTAGWVRVDKYIFEENSRCQIDIAAKWHMIKPLQINKISPFTIGSFDIESISQRGKEAQKNIFPDYSLKDDYITQIGITLYKFGAKECVEVMHTLVNPETQKVDSLENIELFTYKSEKQLILGFFEFLKKIDLDYITGYNINTFDWTYIYERCKLLEIENHVGSLSRLNEQPAKYIEEQLVSNAAGENKFKYILIPGVINSDLYTIVKREQKLVSYKLDFVAKTHIGDQKDPLSPLDIFNMALGTPKEIATVCYYCSKDCKLVLDLIKKLCIIPNNFGMANVTSVPVEYIEYKGQQVKVHAQLAYDARKADYLIPTIPYKDTSKGDEEEKFTGATVQDAEQDAHFEPVSGLDFASLYPSIMIANNFSYETRVKDDKYLNIEGIEYKKIVWTEDKGKETEREEEVIFVQNKQGLLPKILDRLWKERKAIKKEMKVIKGQIKELQKKIGEEKESNKEIEKIKEEISDLEFMYQVKDGYQLAMKVSMNSIYGFTGAGLGRLPDKRIAAATTAEGRRMIQACKEYVESNYNCKVVYGDTDSIYVKFFTGFEGQEHMNEVFRLSEIAAVGCSNLFKKPVEMEFEKVMDPFILFCKKRYACVVWTNPHTHDYIDYKGIQVVRRDNCPMVKDRSIEIFESILLEKNIPKSISQARDNVYKLLNGEVPIKDLIISKSLKGYGSYEFDKQAICVECEKRWYTLDESNKKVYRIPMKEKKTLEENLREFMAKQHYCYNCKEETDFKSNFANIPHVALARTMEKRDKYNCPVVGERVPYVFKKTKNKKDCQFKKVEDPDYLIKNCLEIDYEYYFEHQLKSALDTIFAPILKDKMEETLYSGLLPEKPKKRTRKVKE